MKAWFCFMAALMQLAWGAVVYQPPAERQPQPPAAEEPAYPLDAYVREAYLKPVWEGGLVYHESVMPLEAPDGSTQDIQLLYEASEILSVRSSDLQTEYLRGTDYELADGKLRLLDGAIPRVAWAAMYPPKPLDPLPPNSLLFPGRDVPWILIEGAALFHSWQLAVTYQHAGAYPGTLPPGRAASCPAPWQSWRPGNPCGCWYTATALPWARRAAARTPSTSRPTPPPSSICSPTRCGRNTAARSR